MIYVTVESVSSGRSVCAK